MSQKNNILYIPIQINGGATVPANLLERELFIKNGELYVGDSSGKPTMIIGKVVKGATIEDVTLKGKLILDSSLIKTKETLPRTASEGQIFFVDEGKGYN